jgi:hypothetical protein
MYWEEMEKSKQKLIFLSSSFFGSIFDFAHVFLPDHGTFRPIKSNQIKGTLIIGLVADGEGHGISDIR